MKKEKMPPLIHPDVKLPVDKKTLRKIQPEVDKILESIFPKIPSIKTAQPIKDGKPNKG